jgi:hypothetical protein
MPNVDDYAILGQGVARRAEPLRWPRSQKLACYYDPDKQELLYQDARGQVIDRIDLKVFHRTPLTDR